MKPCCLSIMFTLQIIKHHTTEGLAVTFGEFDVSVCVCVTNFCLFNISLLIIGYNN